MIHSADTPFQVNTKQIPPYQAFLNDKQIKTSQPTKKKKSSLSLCEKNLGKYKVLEQ